MIHKYVFRAALLGLVALGLSACGSSDDNSNGSSGGDLTQKCKDVCAAQVAGDCALGGADLCNSVCDSLSAASDDCKAAIEAVEDCQLAAPDVCTADCSAQMEAESTACGAQG